MAVAAVTILAEFRQGSDGTRGVLPSGTRTG